MRSAASSALVAFVASRAESKPLADYIFKCMEDAGLPAAGARAVYIAESEAALDALASGLDEVRAAQVRQDVSDGVRCSKMRIEAMLSGRTPEVTDNNAGRLRGAGFVDEAGQEDPEHIHSRSVPRLQRALSRHVDACNAQSLCEEWISQGPTHHSRRLADLQHETVSHEWLWSLSPHSIQTLEPDIYADAVRLRLGAPYHESPARCRVCRRQAVPGAEHALCCAPGPSHEGHNAVRDRVLALARLGDPAAEKEVVGLLPAAPGNRPADVLTSAAGGVGLSALDIGVASPDSEAAIANGDALEAMKTRKLREQAPWQAALKEQEVRYRPIPWSAWGREHADTSVVVEALCRRAARRRALLHWRVVLRTFRGDIAALLARRAASMARACFLSVGDA